MTSFSARFENHVLMGMDWQLPGEPEFLKIGRNVFESEEIINTIYSVYLPMITDVIEGDNIRIADVATPYANGLYLPCVERLVLAGQVDLRNDSVPEYSSLILDPDKDADFSFFSTRRTRLPRGWARTAEGVTCSVTGIWNRKTLDRKLRKSGHRSALSSVTVYVIVRSDGSIVPAKRLDQLVGGAAIRALYCRGAAASINAWTDVSDYIWRVEVQEELLGSGIKTPLILGCSAEHIKSLFYARSTPVTESGRKRPILHWVREHIRRLREGIEIDIARHLRGIEKFHMEGFDFEIKSPSKAGL